MSNQEQNTKTSPKSGGAMFGGHAAVPGEKAKRIPDIKQPKQNRRNKKRRPNRRNNDR